jgi:hypothetical protein
MFADMMDEFVKYTQSFKIYPSKLKLKEAIVEKILRECKGADGFPFVYNKKEMYATDKRLYIRGIQIDIVKD